ncbi:ABC transporter permease [Patescibacteria group bacterium]|nr:ABC transporter permease [Patescibacteria group bacterium]
MVKIIRPKKILSTEDFKEVWRFRELLYFFVWREYKIRYKQTMIGVLWAVFQPFITMVVFSIFFGKLAEMPSDGVPYPLFVFTGLIFWQFFSGALVDTADSLVRYQGIVTKVYFPRLILPLAVVTVKFVDLLINLVILFFIMIYYSYVPYWEVIFVFPLLFLLVFGVAVGPGLILASLNVKYRDIRYVLPFFVQLLLFMTPVIYPASIAKSYEWILKLNPMTGVIEAARSSALNSGPIDWPLLSFSGVVCLFFLSIGIYFFKKTERFFADIV